MISDLLAKTAVLDKVEGIEDIDAAIEAVLETTDREVAEQERKQFRETLEGGWLE
jgi:hypothetical protein